MTILFMDIVGFTSMSKEVPPDAVMTFLNQLFTHFDLLCDSHRVQKVRGLMNSPVAQAVVLLYPAQEGAETFFSQTSQILKLLVDQRIPGITSTHLLMGFGASGKSGRLGGRVGVGLRVGKFIGTPP